MSKQALVKEEPIRICNTLRKLKNRKTRRVAKLELRMTAKGGQS